MKQRCSHFPPLCFFIWLKQRRVEYRWILAVTEHGRRIVHDAVQEDIIHSITVLSICGHIGKGRSRAGTMYALRIQLIEREHILPVHIIQILNNFTVICNGMAFRQHTLHICDIGYTTISQGKARICRISCTISISAALSHRSSAQLCASRFVSSLSPYALLYCLQKARPPRRLRNSRRLPHL